MLQKGVAPGTATPITVNDLQYTYTSPGNKLQSVTYLMTVTNANGPMGDLKDGSNGNNPIYVYDANGKMGAYDYFIMDYQKNVRMILTEEIHAAAKTATIENNRASAEDPVFGQICANNEVETKR